MSAPVDVLVAAVRKAFEEGNLGAQDAAVAVLLEAAREVEAAGERHLELWRELPLGFARIRNRGGDPSSAEAAANVIEAATYRSVLHPDMRQLLVLTAPVTSEGPSGAEHENADPFATAVRMLNRTIVAMLRDDSMLETFLRVGNRYFSHPEREPGVDARGMLELADEMLDRSTDGALHKPRLWLARAYALALLAASNPEEETLAAAARRAMRLGENAQQALPIGDDDAQYWIERSFLAALPAFQTSPNDASLQSIDAGTDGAFARQCASATRALAAAAESGRSDVITVAIQRACELLGEWPSRSDTRAVHATAVALARGVLAFDLTKTQRFVALAALVRATATGGVDAPGVMREALRAGAQLCQDYPDVDGARVLYAVVLGRHAWTAPTLAAAQGALPELQRLRFDGAGEWQIVVAILRVLRRVAELGRDPARLWEALELGSGPIGGTGTRDADGQLLFERIGCAMDLIEMDPSVGLDPLLGLLALEPRTGNHSAGRVVLAMQHSASATAPADAVEAARLIYERCVRLDQDDPSISFVGAIDAAKTPFADAVPRALPLNFDFEDLERAALDVLPSGNGRSVLAERLFASSAVAREDEEFTPLAALNEATLKDKLGGLMRVSAAWNLFMRYNETKDPATLDAVVAIVVPEDSKADRDAPDKGLLLSVLDAVSRRDQISSSRDGRQLLLIQDIIDDDTLPLAVRLTLTRRWQRHWGGIFWRMVWQPFESQFEELEKRLREGAGAELLVPAQGIAADAAYAAAVGGEPVRAIEIAERGQGLLAAQALRRHGISTDLLHIDHPGLYGAWAVAVRRLRAADSSAMPRIEAFAFRVPTDPPTRLVTPLELMNSLSARSAEVRKLVEAEQSARSDLEAMAGPILPNPDVAALVAHAEHSGARLCYLVSTGWGGVALILDPEGRISAIELPELKSWAIAPWIEQIENAPEDVEARSVAVRGASSEPQLAVTLAVIDEISRVLAPLVEVLAADDSPIQLIPTGQLARLPVVAALQSAQPDDGWFDLSVAASGRLHIAAANRLRRTETNDAVVAITNPRPATRSDGVDLPDLPAATREGEQLIELLGGIHYTRGEATLPTAMDALAEPNRVLHFAVHGTADPDNPERSRMYLANAGDGFATELTAEEVARSPLNSRLVYLGSCWTGRPGTRLPDEAIGFPTLLLQSGAAGVVAPLWPISDAAAATFSAAFYRAWAIEEATAGRALAEAMRHTRARHPRSMTWAAFALHGV